MREPPAGPRVFRSLLGLSGPRQLPGLALGVDARDQPLDVVVIDQPPPPDAYLQALGTGDPPVLAYTTVQAMPWSHAQGSPRRTSQVTALSITAKKTSAIRSAPLYCQVVIDPDQLHALLARTATPGTRSADRLRLLSVVRPHDVAPS